MPSTRVLRIVLLGATVTLAAFGLSSARGDLIILKDGVVLRGKTQVARQDRASCVLASPTGDIGLGLWLRVSPTSRRTLGFLPGMMKGRQVISAEL